MEKKKKAQKERRKSESKCVFPSSPLKWNFPSFFFFLSPSFAISGNTQHDLIDRTFRGNNKKKRGKRKKKKNKQSHRLAALSRSPSKMREKQPKRKKKWYPPPLLLLYFTFSIGCNSHMNPHCPRRTPSGHASIFLHRKQETAKEASNNDDVMQTLLAFPVIFCFVFVFVFFSLSFLFFFPPCKK